jgi:hypothetical protein
LEPRPTGTGCDNSRLRLRPCRLRLERPESSTSDTAADCRRTAHFAVYCWRQRPVCACRALGGGKTCPPLRRFVPARGGRNLRSRSFLAVYPGCNLCRPPRTYVDLGFVGPTCPMCVFEQLLAPYCLSRRRPFWLLQLAAEHAQAGQTRPSAPPGAVWLAREGLWPSGPACSVERGTPRHEMIMCS